MIKFQVGERYNAPHPVTGEMAEAEIVEGQHISDHRVCVLVEWPKQESFPSRLALSVPVGDLAPLPE